MEEKIITQVDHAHEGCATMRKKATIPSNASYNESLCGPSNNGYSISSSGSSFQPPQRVLQEECMKNLHEKRLFSSQSKETHSQIPPSTLNSGRLRRGDLLPPPRTTPENVLGTAKEQLHIVPCESGFHTDIAFNGIPRTREASCAVIPFQTHKNRGPGERLPAQGTELVTMPLPPGDPSQSLSVQFARVKRMTGMPSSEFATDMVDKPHPYLSAVESSSAGNNLSEGVKSLMEPVREIPHSYARFRVFPEYRALRNIAHFHALAAVQKKYL